ncbi:MerR family transcriptional regulator [Erythrobacter pelagi]|jgi:DNA-binding transcriptional MerR regulator|uniref:MerR family transcriptional regulator n=1 Tax=Qipengyuania pelagi TaxID=994320 RepID=A0A844Y4G1_9SPHN|nr:MerR family transcriptional regulator [Qipengyuania pelagi]MXO52881.1 MerR family transcriptional regulator [Qipengyuania pelagi]
MAEFDATFDDGKDDGALRTIGEVARALGIKQHVLRYWEQQFPQLQPLKRSGNRRYYRPADIALIERIDRLVNRDGYTLKGAEAALREPEDRTAGPSTDNTVAQDRGAEMANILPRLKAIRDDLRRALAA